MKRLLSSVQPEALARLLSISRESFPKITRHWAPSAYPSRHLTNATKEFPHATLALTGASHPNQHLLQGQDALCRLIQNTHADLVLNAIAGASGLHASLYTLEKGIDLALANKESIVMAGSISKIAEKMVRKFYLWTQNTRRYFTS